MRSSLNNDPGTITSEPLKERQGADLLDRATKRSESIRGTLGMQYYRSCSNVSFSCDFAC